MKYLLFVSILFSSFSLFAADYSIEPGKMLKIDKQDCVRCNAEIKNQSGQELKIAVRDLSCGELLSGFGLGKQGKETVYISDLGTLFITNNGDKKAKVKVTFTKSAEPKVMTGAIDFTLENTSDKSISLFIPDVMNPNLSPNSKSSVKLKTGQKIMFKHKGKKVLLLEVTDGIKNGDIIDVAKLLEERKAVL